MKKQPAYGFTLMELLVVIAITGLLAALLFSALGMVRRSGRQTQSTQNLRVISVGLTQYVGEHGRLPESAISCSFREAKINFWFNAIGPYIEGEDYLQQWEKKAERPKWQQCPARPFTTFATLWSRGISVGYGWNHMQFGYDAQDASVKKYGYAIRLSQVSHPSATIIIGTNREYNDDGSPILPDNAGNLLVYSNKPNSTRFDGAGLYLMLDGHVERLTPEEALANDGYLFKRVK